MAVISVATALRQSMDVGVTCTPRRCVRATLPRLKITVDDNGSQIQGPAKEPSTPAFSSPGTGAHQELVNAEQRGHLSIECFAFEKSIDRHRRPDQGERSTIDHADLAPENANVRNPTYAEGRANDIFNRNDVCRTFVESG